MSRPQRIAQYIQQLAYQSLIQHDERDERPDDAPPRAPDPTPTYGSWSATSFLAYVPFRSPPNG
jgi:hypothetical protein